MLKIHIAVLLFGLSGLFGKFIDIPAPTLTLGRVVFAALALLLILLISKRSLAINKGKDLLGFIILGALLAFHWTSFFQSIQMSSVAIGVLTFSTFPAFTNILEPLIFRERYNFRNLALSLLCFTGVALIVPRFDIQAEDFQSILWGIGSGFSFALLSLMNRHYVSQYSHIALTFYQCSFAALFLLPTLFVATIAPDLSDWVLLIILGVVFTALAHSFFISAMEHIKVQTLSILSSLESVYGIGFAWMLLEEGISGRMALGGVIILVSAYLVSQKKAAP